MTAVDTAPRAVPADARVTFPRLVRSEWLKLWSVRSTTWTLGITAVVIVGLALLSTWGMLSVSDMDGASLDLDPLDAFGGTVIIGPLAAVVLGALTITGEYTTGMIRSSLTAAPTRLPVLWSKAAVLGVVVFVVSAVSVAVAAVLQALIFGGQDMAVDAGDPQVLRALTGNAVYVAAIALLAFAIGALLRHSAAAIAATLGLLLIVPVVIQFIPWEPLGDVIPFLPNLAGGQMTLTDEAIAENTSDIVLSAWEGFGVLVAWIAAALVPAAVLLKKRDA